jgi:hypothetical protein
VCAQPHFNVCKEVWVKLDNKHWYDYVRKSVEISREGKETVLWDEQVTADRTIPDNKPDIVNRDNEKRNMFVC